MKHYLSSFLTWASSYVKANFDAITDFVNRTFTISASGVNSCFCVSHDVLGAREAEQTQMAENARRSTKGRNEHKFVPSSDGNMSMRLSTRYTVVPLAAASVSMGVSGCTKCVTSAISVHRVHNLSITIDT